MDMTDTDTFLTRLLAARRAAWLVLLCGVALQLVTYAGFLAIEHGWVDSLVEAGVYGGVSSARLAEVTFLFVAALKLMNIAILMGALFLTFWARGLRR
jgi:hypothetical protein